MVRYIRLSLSLCAGLRPAMNELKALLNKAMSKEKSRHHPCDGEIFLLRLMMNMYEECDGVQSMEDPRVSGGGGAVEAKGIRLEDIPETGSPSLIPHSP